MCFCGQLGIACKGGRGVRACLDGSGHLYHSSALCISMRMCMVGPCARAHGVAMGMGMAMTCAGILLAIMRPGQLNR